MHESIVNNYIHTLFEFKERTSSISMDDQDEISDFGSSYTLLGSESKLFWRTQDTFIVDFYHHEYFNCVEAVIQNSHIKGHRISTFFDYSLLKSNLHRMHGTMRTVQAFQVALIAFIMERLQQDSSGEVRYQPLSSDPPSMHPQLQLPPSKILPAAEKTIRLYHSSSHEIDAAVSGLSGETFRLRIATAQARKYSELTSKAILTAENTPHLLAKPDMVKHVSSGEFSPNASKVGENAPIRSSMVGEEWNFPLSLRSKKRASSDRSSV